MNYESMKNVYNYSTRQTEMKKKKIVLLLYLLNVLYLCQASSQRQTTTFPHMSNNFWTFNYERNKVK